MSQGLQVACASNGQEALSLMLGGLHPSVVVLDLMMPVMSGQELLARLDQEPDLRGVPVIVVSAAPMRELLVSPRVLLPKPFDCKDLTMRFRDWLPWAAQFRSNAVGRAAAATGAAAAPVLKPKYPMRECAVAGSRKSQ